MRWLGLFTNKTFRKHLKLIFPHRDFIICIVSLAIFHPHFVIRIFPSAFFYPPSAGIRSALYRDPRNTGFQLLVCHVDFQLLAHLIDKLLSNFTLPVKFSFRGGNENSWQQALLTSPPPQSSRGSRQISRETQINLAQNKSCVRPKWRACSQARSV